MTDLAIRVDNLSKRYRIGAPQERYYTLRDTLTGALSAPFRRIRAHASRFARSHVPTVRTCQR